MLIFDGHIHIQKGKPDIQSFSQKLAEAGVSGGVLISQAPDSFYSEGTSISSENRLQNLFTWCKIGDNFHPLYWIDPLEDDAHKQIQAAVGMNVAGFKVICDRFYPSDPRAMKVFRLIAKNNLPILFHSGILWDGKPSSQYNKPASFEALLEIEGLRFCLAHMSWPWCDELIAVYGKFLNANIEMFVDITPGTPPIYRSDALIKLFTTGYDMENNVIFGSDCSVNTYNDSWVRQWIKRDNKIFSKLKLGNEVIKKIYRYNLERFLGLSSERIEKKTPLVAE